jgi:hypothetical protein
MEASPCREPNTSATSYTLFETDFNVMSSTRGLFSSRFVTNSFYAYLISAIPVTCRDHFSLGAFVATVFVSSTAVAVAL